MAEPGEFLQPVTPNLARVLAQAANSAFVTSDTFYVVCRLLTSIDQAAGSDPYNVQTPAPTYADAQGQVTWLQQNDPTFQYGIFGPFSNTFSGFDRPPPPTQLQVASLDVTAGAGTVSDSIPIEGTSYDALFWSVEVVQKMLIPYYAQEYGPDYAQTVLTEFYAAPVALVAHLPWSEYGAIGPGGELLTGGSNPQAPATCGGANAVVAGNKPAKRIAVVLQRDGDGKLQPKPLHPAQPAKA